MVIPSYLQSETELKVKKRIQTIFLLYMKYFHQLKKPSQLYRSLPEKDFILDDLPKYYFNEISEFQVSEGRINAKNIIRFQYNSKQFIYGIHLGLSSKYLFNRRKFSRECCP